MVNFGLLMAEIGSGGLGTPANFNWFRVLAIVWLALAVVIPALLVLLATSLLLKKWLVSVFLAHTSSINLDNFEPKCYMNL